jgi:quercetin dioxygenase-like cupin family protein
VRTTIFTLTDGKVEFQMSSVPPWAEPDEFGQVAAELHRSPNGASTLYRIPAGCSVPIHSGPGYALCQIMAGRGKLLIPSGEEIDYHGPELFIFEPGALHGWRHVTEDTLLTVCEVRG